MDNQTPPPLQNPVPPTQQPIQSPYQQGVPTPQPTPPKKPFPAAWLICWLAAWPLSIVIALISRLAFGASQALVTLSNIMVILLGIYGMIGWIPFVVVLAKRKK